MKRVLQFWRMPWSALFGACVGVLMVLSTPEIVTDIRGVYDKFRPVLKMSGTVVSRDEDSVTLHITGEKLRGEECRLLSVFGYSVDKDGRLFDALAERIDRTATRRVREQGNYDIGLWRVKPITPDAVGVQVVAQHDCVGRVVLTVMAEARL